MQPDLFAGPAQRDDSYRILARLAHGGSLPTPARSWRLGATLRSRLVVAGGLLSLCAVAWVWLGSAHKQPPPGEMAAPTAPGPAPRERVDIPQPVAATIVSQVEPPVPPPAAPAHAASTPPQTGTARPAAAAAREPAKLARRGAPAAVTPQRSAAPVENDEDVTLLTAMLKHAKPQKPPVSPPPKD
ncbi:hypothetical protein [Pseudoduganella sp.]|uniref:hypothetical protein n=1 Tax=Pseudoduganella sp. TaxID=1880898 RepID=UPI0035B311FD